MPISGDRFEDIDDEGPTPGTNAHAILSFLASNPEQAFTQSEIAAATDVTRGSVGPTLVRLRERGRVDHRGTYWRVADAATESADAATESADAAAEPADAAAEPADDDGPSAVAAEDAAATADTAADDGSDGLDFDDWQPYAVDPRDDGDGYEVGAVVWAPGPSDEGVRPWVVLASDSLPSPVREYTCVPLTGDDRPDAVPVGDDWRVGHHPDRAVYCLPDERATIVHRNVRAPQGAVASSFADRLAASGGT
jgi:hypothetical protein